MIDRIQTAMREWAEQSGPPAEIEAAVLAEFDRVGQARAWRRWAMTVAAVAASVVVAWVGGRQPEAPVVQDTEELFTALPYVIQPAVYESTEVVRMTVPVSELIAAGFSMQADPGAEVEADVLLGQDRRARAVRLVVISE